MERLTGKAVDEVPVNSILEFELADPALPRNAGLEFHNVLASRRASRSLDRQQRRRSCEGERYCQQDGEGGENSRESHDS